MKTKTFARRCSEADRLMRSQNRYFDRCRYFHGVLESANLIVVHGRFCTMIGTGVERRERRIRVIVARQNV